MAVVQILHIYCYFYVLDPCSGLAQLSYLIGIATLPWPGIAKEGNTLSESGDAKGWIKKVMDAISVIAA